MNIHNFKVALAVVAIALAMPAQAAGGAATANAASNSAKADDIAPAGRVMIGDFEGKATPNKQYGTLILNHGHGEFGWGWSAYSDQRIGGHSLASIALIQPGADGTRGALRVSGEIKPGFPYPWAGAFWYPGHQPMEPGDLSAKKELVFWARGDGRSYAVMIMSGSPNGIPQGTEFTTTTRWKEYHIPLATSFLSADLKHVFFIGFSAGEGQGKFQLDIDQVVLR